MLKQLLSIALIIPASVCLAQNAPVDFEEGGFGSTWNWNVFENAEGPGLEIVSNPDPSGINTSATVAKFTAVADGAPFAGCETMHGSDIGTFTVTAANSIVTIMVWKSVISDVGIKLVAFDNSSLGEIKVPNTLTEQWEQISINFSSHIGMTFDQIVVFPDFRDRNEDEIIYFDNIYGDLLTSVSDVKEVEPTLFYPNPVESEIRINPEIALEELQIVNITGQIVFQELNRSVGRIIDLSHLPVGIYSVSVLSNGQRRTEKMIKR